MPANTPYSHRFRSTGGAAGAPASLLSAELSYNMADGIWYAGYGDNGSGIATSIRAVFKDDFNVAQRIPVGGTTGQVLTKNSNSDLDVTWSAAGATYTGGSGVTVTGTVIAADFTVVAPLASPALSGTPTAPTPTTTDNTTKIATTAYVKANLASYAVLASPALTGNPTAPTQAANDNSTKLATTAYVDSAVTLSKQGLAPKQSVRLISTTNIALSGLLTVDGVVTVAGDRVLAAGQTTASQNGIYIVAAGAWTRATDADTWAKVLGAYVLAELGTNYAGHGFIMTNDPNVAGTIGTTAMTWAEFTGASDITAGNGLSKAGNTLSVAAGTGITVGGGSVALTGNALALAGLTGAADTGLYFTGASAMAVFTLTAFARTFCGSVDAAAGRTNLGLGTMATQAASAVAITGGTIANVTINNSVIAGGTF